MPYVVDTNVLFAIFRHYYFDSFPTFWNKFEALVASGEIYSVREVFNEIKAGNQDDTLGKWANQNRHFFKDPTPEELRFITEIFSVPHFQQNLAKKRLLHGGAYADPFIIAKAKIDHAMVITQEKFKTNGSQIPAICNHFNIPSVDLEGFLKKENWVF